MYTYGRKAVGSLVPVQVLPYSLETKLYEIHIQSSFIANKQALAKRIIQEASQRNLHISWLSINDTSLQMQIQGNSLAVSDIIVFLPEIFTLLGLILIGLSLLLVLAYVPIWVFGVMALGTLFLGVGYLYKPKRGY